MLLTLEQKLALIKKAFPSLEEAGIQEAAKTLNLDDSHNGLYEKVSRALRTKFEASGSAIWPWVRDLFGGDASGTVVYSADRKLYSASYTVSGDQVTLGEGTRVILAYIPAKKDVQEALIIQSDENRIEESEDGGVSELVPIRESAITPDGKGLLKLIAPGHGSSGYYSKDVLRDAAKTRVFPKGTQMFMDHATESEERERPEGSVKNLMGVLESDAEYRDDGPDGPGLYAPIRVYSDFIGFVNERAKDIGNSIRAVGTKVWGQIGGRPTAIIQKLTASKSVDFVTRAGAGGKLVPLFESYRQKQLESNSAATSRNSNQESNMTEAEIKAMQDRMSALEATNRTLREAAVNNTAKAFFADRVAASEIKLPAKAQQRVKERLIPVSGVSGLPLTESGDLDTAKFQAQVDAAIKDESDYLKESAPVPAGIRSMGDGGSPAPGATDLTEAAKTFKASISALAGIPIKEDK